VRYDKTRGSVLSKTIIIIVLALSGLALFALTAFHIFPMKIAEEKLRAALASQGLVVSYDSLERTFPIGLRASNIELAEASDGKALMKFDDATATLDISSLLLGTPSVRLWAAAGTGVITGEIRPGLNGARLDLTASNIEFRMIPALTAAGIDTEGSFGGTVSAYLSAKRCPTGTARLRSGPVSEQGLRLAGVQLPIGDIDSGGLNAEFKDCKAVVEGLWLDGKELSARLSGEIFLRSPLSASPIKMVLELTPRGEAGQQSWVLAFMNSFRRSANYYSANISGTIGRPVAQR